MIECRILGPVECHWAGRPLPLSAGRQQKVIARLALDAGRVVPVSELVDALWAGPPPSAARLVRNAVSDLRLAWARAGVPLPADVIVTAGSGYLLHLPADALDAARFEHLVAHADSAAGVGDLAEATTALRDALALWHGPALSGLTGGVFAAAAVAWTERRLAAWGRRISLDLALDRHRAVVPELVELVAAYPYREQFTGLLMFALRQCGQQAQALSAFRQLRERLAADLGVDPDPRVAHLHAAILRQDPPVTPVL